MVIERGADFFEPMEPPPDGDITFEQAKDIVNGRMVLGGNIESRIIEKENIEIVEKTVREAFKGNNRFMVLKPTAFPIGQLSSEVIANYHKLIDVWEELSIF